MPRYAAANKTINDLSKRIKNYDDIYNYVNGECTGSAKVMKDLSKIKLDFENADFINEFNTPGTESMAHYEMIGDFPVVWCAAGGDWQLPVVFCLYIGENNEIRGYIPSEGNVYDHKNKCAYTGDDKISYTFNADKLREDVKNRIQIKNNNTSGSLKNKSISKIVTLIKDQRIPIYKDKIANNQVTDIELGEMIKDLKKDYEFIKAFKNNINWYWIDPTCYSDCTDINFLKHFVDEFNEYIEFDETFYNEELFNDREFVLNYGSQLDFSEGGSQEMLDTWHDDDEIMEIIKNRIEWGDVNDIEKYGDNFIKKYGEYMNYDDNDCYDEENDDIKDCEEDIEDDELETDNNKITSNFAVNDTIYFINNSELFKGLNRFDPMSFKSLVRNAVTSGTVETIYTDNIDVKEDSTGNIINVDKKFIYTNQQDAYKAAVNDLSDRVKDIISYLNDNIKSFTF